MKPEALNALPLWAQIVFYVGAGLGLIVLGFRRYVKSGDKAEPARESQLVAGAIFDTHSMRDLKEALERQTDESHRVRQALRDHCDCLNDNTDALKASTRNPRRRSG